MLLVTCAGGRVGKTMVRKLIKLGIPVRTITRTDQSAEILRKSGAEVYCGDCLNPNDVQKALDGCDNVLCIPPGFSYQETLVAETVIDAAAKMPVKHFILLSAAHPIMKTMPHHTAKLKAEQYLLYKSLETELPYTVLEPVSFYQNWDIEEIINTGKATTFYSPSASVALVDAEDVAEIVYKVLQDYKHQFATYEIAAEGHITQIETMERINRILGLDANLNYILPETFIKMCGITDSYQAECVKRMSNTYSNLGFKSNANICKWLLGRAPTTIEAYALREMERLKSSSDF